MPFCPTRWTNLFDILNWGKRNIKRIFTVLKTNNRIIKNLLEPFIEEVKFFLFKIIPNYYRIFFIYSKLIKILESDHCSASRSTLVYETFFNLSKEFIQDDSIGDENIHFSELVESIKKRLYGTGNYELLYFLSSFTFQGRKLIRDSLASSHVFESDPMYIKFKHQTFLDDNDLLILEKFKEEDYKYISQIESNYDNNSQEDSNEDQDEKYLYSSDYSGDDTQSDQFEFIENENLNGEIDSIIEIGSIYLEKYAKNIGLNNFEENELKKSYYDWIVKPLDQITPNLQYVEKDLEIWALLGLRKRWNHLAVFAARVLTIPASEACCERFFSRQRLAIPKNRRRTSKKLEGARMSYV